MTRFCSALVLVVSLAGCAEVRSEPPPAPERTQPPRNSTSGASKTSAANGTRSPSSPAPSAAVGVKAAGLVQVGGRAFTPLPGIDLMLRRALAAPDHGTLPGLVQLSAVPGPAQRAELARAGVTLAVHLGQAAYIARFGPNADLVAIESLVRWAGPLLPEDRLDDGLRNDQPEDWARASDGRLKVLVWFFDDVPLAARLAAVESASGHSAEPGPGGAFALELTPSQVRALASHDVVRRIEQGPAPFLPL